MSPSSGWTALSRLIRFLLLVFIVCLVGVSGIFLLSQAVRTVQDREWTKNGNAFVIGASYAAVLVVTLLFQLKRKIAIRRKLRRISKVHKTLGKGDVPESVYSFISQEFARTCLIAHESQPSEMPKESVDRPAIDTRKALLATIPEIDTSTRSVIQHQPPLMPHARMLHHLRTIVGLFPRDEYGLTVVHYYDSAIQLARQLGPQPTPDEFRLGMEAVSAIKRILIECRQEMSESSSINSSKYDLSSMEL